MINMPYLLSTFKTNDNKPKLKKKFLQSWAKGMLTHIRCSHSFLWWLQLWQRLLATRFKSETQVKNT